MVPSVFPSAVTHAHSSKWSRYRRTPRTPRIDQQQRREQGNEANDAAEMTKSKQVGKSSGDRWLVWRRSRNEWGNPQVFGDCSHGKVFCSLASHSAHLSLSLNPQYAARSLELSLYRGVWRYLESISDSWKRGVAFYESLVVRMDCFIPGTASLLEQVDRTCEQPEQSMPMAGLRRYRRSHTLDMIHIRHHHV